MQINRLNEQPKKYHVRNPLISDVQTNFFIITDYDLKNIEAQADAQWGTYAELVITHLDKMSIPNLIK